MSTANVGEAINRRLAPYDALKASNIITEEDCNKFKRVVVQEEVERLEKGKLPLTDSFGEEEMKRQSWLREIRNQRDLCWRMHQAAVDADPDAWENKMVDKFISLDIGNELSPLLALIGRYLLFVDNHKYSRRCLPEIMYLQDASARLTIHNWNILASAPEGTDVREGKKEEDLTVPPLPYGNNSSLQVLHLEISTTLLFTTRIFRQLKLIVNNYNTINLHLFIY